MESLALIKTLCYTIENQTRFVCQDVSDDDARWRPDVGSPSIGWTVGHILINHDLTVNHRICENPILFNDLIEHFGFATTGDFPEQYTLNDLFEKFQMLNSQIVGVLLEKKSEWLNEKFDDSGFPPNWQGKNRGKAFIMNFNHCIAHTGQILEIKRMKGLGAWGF